MPAIDFPNSPALNDLFTSGDRTWKWNGYAWEAFGTLIGATGPTGPTGSAASISGNAPIAYDSGLEEISLNYGSGLILSGTGPTANLVTYIANPLKFESGAVTVNVGAGLVTTANALTVNATSGLVVTGGAVTANVGSGLVVTSNAITVNTAVTATLTDTQTLTGKTFTAPREKFQVVVSTPTTGASAVQLDALSGSVAYYTVASTSAASFPINFRGNSGTPLNDVLPAVGDSITLGLLLTTGTSASWVGALTIDSGATVLVEWQLGAIPSSGNASSVDSYLFTIVKTAHSSGPTGSSYTIFASRTRFA
jgi:hypothetical protein